MKRVILAIDESWPEERADEPIEFLSSLDQHKHSLVLFGDGKWAWSTRDWTRKNGFYTWLLEKPLDPKLEGVSFKERMRQNRDPFHRAGIARAEEIMVLHSDALMAFWDGKSWPIRGLLRKAERIKLPFLVKYSDVMQGIRWTNNGF